MYSTVTMYFATLEDVSRKEKILCLINDLNQKYKNSKYFINDDNEIGVEGAYIADSSSFNAELFINVSEIMFQDLIEETYNEFMKIVC
ncbi:TPA: hypothetical protein ACG3QH_001928 [Clostridioides difficile]